MIDFGALSDDDLAAAAEGLRMEATRVRQTYLDAQHLAEDLWSKSLDASFVARKASFLLEMRKEPK